MMRKMSDDHLDPIISEASSPSQKQGNDSPLMPPKGTLHSYVNLMRGEKRHDQLKDSQRINQKNEELASLQGRILKKKEMNDRLQQAFQRRESAQYQPTEVFIQILPICFKIAGADRKGREKNLRLAIELSRLHKNSKQSAVKLILIWAFEWIKIIFAFLQELLLLKK